jgi:hypothetical protein
MTRPRIDWPARLFREENNAARAKPKHGGGTVLNRMLKNKHQGLRRRFSAIG